MWTISKRRKPRLFAFIVLIIAVLLFSVIGIVAVYLNGGAQQVVEQEAYLQQFQDALTASGITVTTWSGEVLNLSWSILTGEEAAVFVWTGS